jgi:hypothetical protein
MRRSELRMGVTLIMEWKRILVRNGANYCEMVQIGARRLQWLTGRGKNVGLIRFNLV